MLHLRWSRYELLGHLNRIRLSELENVLVPLLRDVPGSVHHERYFGSFLFPWQAWKFLLLSHRNGRALDKITQCPRDQSELGGNPKKRTHWKQWIWQTAVEKTTNTSRVFTCIFLKKLVEHTWYMGNPIQHGWWIDGQ